MKTCINCGKELPDQAAWCPYCETEQRKPETVRMPVRRRRKILAALAAVAVLCICALSAVLYHRPKVYEGGAQVMYRLNGRDCKVFLSFRPSALQTGEAQDSFSSMLRGGDSAAIPSFLFVLSEEDEKMQSAFTQQIGSCTVTASPEDGAQVAEIVGPHLGEEAGNAAASADIVYWPEIGTNTICWEITMKNRDVIRLYQTVECRLQPVVTYHYEETSMDTLEELQAVLDQAAKEAPDTLVELYLPPVTYEGGLEMDTRTAILYGSEEDGSRTTFTDTVTVSTRVPYMAEFYNLEFAGDGGYGIISTDALKLRNCMFTGWDVGVDVRNGGWVSASDTSFAKNGTGFRFDSLESTYSNPTYENLVFTENETGMEVRNIPGDGELNLFGAVFDSNKTDLEDPDGRVILAE